MRTAVGAAVCVLCCFSAAAAGPMRGISRQALRDKIEGGWAGQMIGVSFGAPTEFRAQGKILEGELPAWSPGRVANALEQDDLYVDITLAKVLDEKGLDATTEDFGAAFAQAKYSLWHANLAARRALKRGVAAALSGTPQYNVHANDIDFQIEADFIGLMAPGMMRASNRIATRAGRVMNYGDGIYGGMFVSAMYAAAFFENNPRKVVESALAAIPAQSPYGKLIADVLAWHKANPGDWRRVWRLIADHYDRCEPCPAGALRPYNIDAKLNGAYIALGLLYGEGDFGQTLEISTRAGQDSDCNPASAGGVLGVMLGYRNIPEQWKSGIPAIADKKFSYTDDSFRSIVASTEARALALIRREGGRLQGDQVWVKIQKPAAPRLEVWDDYGCPVERISHQDARWQFEGPWRNTQTGRVASTPDASASIHFSGTGAILVGPYLVRGGKADIYLDGKLHRTVDVYPDERSNKRDEAVWHAFGLKPGQHTLRVAVCGEPYPGSEGADIAIQELVVFQPGAH